jgi:hypothetical protein
MQRDYVRATGHRLERWEASVDRSKDEKGEQLALAFDGRQQPVSAPVLLTERQVCELLAIGRTTLRSLPLRPKHINRCVRYLASDVERYVAGLT